jgi:NAD(P)-dependent dehydrogenase (short-subunit alcohol dehydrogenase family)
MSRIFITGSADGLGLAAAQSLLEDGHEVVLHARSRDRATTLAAIEPRAAGIVVGDLSSAAETRDVADQVNAFKAFDAVIHNAGIYRSEQRGSTAEGHAAVLAVNTLAPYILTALIERPRRLIYLSSALHRGGEGSLGDLDWDRRRWDTGRAYAETKLHAAALANGLARRWPRIVSSAVDPGWVRTKMGGSSAPVDIDTGQRTQSWLAVSEEPRALVSGGYWHDLQMEDPAGEALRAKFQDELFARLADLTGVALP